MDVHELNDAAILSRLVIAEVGGGGGWVVKYDSEDYGEVVVNTEKKPQGAALAACCDEIRREVGARKSSEEAAKRKQEAARRADSKPAAPVPSDGGASKEAVEVSPATFEEELEARFAEREGREVALLGNIAAAELELKQVRKEKAAIKAALEAMG